MNTVPVDQSGSPVAAPAKRPARAGASRRRKGAGAALLCASGLLALPAQAQEAIIPAPAPTHTVTGFTMLDYASLTLTDGTDFDLFGIHYMQRVNDWLYVGAGARDYVDIENR